MVEASFAEIWKADGRLCDPPFLFAERLCCCERL